MRLLVVAPDYASHYFPLSAIAARAVASGCEVVVATGPGLRASVERDGHRWTELRMSAGSNAGLRRTTQPSDDLRPFLTATRRGMVATLRHQADARRHDLLWRPGPAAEETIRIVERERPDAVLVDHLCVAARLGLYAAEVSIATFVPGHPTQLPVAGEVYGFPVAWPAWVEPDVTELDALRRRCDCVSAALAAQATSIVQTIDPAAAPVADVFAALGATVLYNSPTVLRDPERQGLPARHRFLGSCVRPAADVDDDTARWLAGGRPFVYVSLGTFLSARTDVLRRVTAAIAAHGRRAAVAIGSTNPRNLGTLPADWLVRPFLPQVDLIADAHGVVTHGGNNTVTEALAAGRPLVVLPLSTDQFCIAADVERAGVGVSADPNRAPIHELAELVTVFDDPQVTAAAADAGQELARADGPGQAMSALQSVSALGGGQARKP